MEYATLTLRFLLAGIFVFAGLAKVGRLDEFESAVRRYRLLPERAVRPIARSLPPFEIACGALLVLGLGIRAVSAILALALCVFAGAVAVNLLRGRAIDCGCFSLVAPRRIGWRAVVQNLLLAAGAAMVAVAHPDALALDRAIAPSDGSESDSGAAAVLLATAAGLAAFGVLAAAGRFRRAANRAPGHR